MNVPVDGIIEITGLMDNTKRVLLIMPLSVGDDLRVVPLQH